MRKKNQKKKKTKKVRKKRQLILNKEMHEAFFRGGYANPRGGAHFG